MSDDMTIDDLTFVGIDGIRRTFDEHYDTMMCVEQDPTGAHHAIHNQHARIEELEKQNASLEAAIKRQASAARTLRSCALAEVQHLSEMDRSEYFAAHTLDSERDANAILTDRIEELEAKLAKAVEDFITVNRMAEGSGFISDHPICDGCCGIYHLTTATIAELKGEDRG